MGVHFRRNKKPVFFSVALAMLMVMSSAVSAQPKNKLREVTLQLKWKHQFPFAGYSAAIEKGFYEEEGLTVILKEATDEKDPADVVFDGEADFGISTSDILISRSEGKPAVLLASIFQHSAQILIASKESGIEHAQALFGKKIALEPHAADIITYLNDEGVSLDEVILYPHLFDVSSLISGEVDALTAYISDEPFSLKNAGFEYTIIDPSMGGIDFYGDVLFTTEEMIANEKELVSRFRRASLKGWEYAMDNTSELVDLIYSEYSTRHSKEHLTFEAVKMHRLVMPEVVEIGYSNPGRWRRILEIYEEQNMLESSITLDGFFYTDYLTRSDNLPWRLLIIFSLSLIAIASATVFYYNTARKLRVESDKRLKTQQQLIEREHQLKASNAAKDKFFSILAHDLRNPFSAITGLTDLMIMDVQDKKSDKLLENLLTLKEACLQTSELLNNLLIWSRSQVGSIEFNPEIIELSMLIEKSVSLVNNQAAQKNISLKIKADERLIVFADKNMLNTILLNLLTNAVKFTKAGGHVIIGVNQTAKKTEVFVKDSGVGISKENIEKLFGIDTRYRTSGTFSEQGSGLGLLLCKEFVEKHGGRIHVESEEGKGSTFSFILPKLQAGNVLPGHGG